MVGVTLGNHGPKLVLQDLLEGFLLVSFELRVVQKLFPVLIPLCDVEDQFGVDHNRSDYQCTTILLDETFV